MNEFLVYVLILVLAFCADYLRRIALALERRNEIEMLLRANNGVIK